MISEIRFCKRHGYTEYVYRKDGAWRCKKCATDSVAKRRHILKLKAVEYKGGKCEICGYNKCIDALEFHHLDPQKKEFGIAQRGYTYSWNRVKNELDKCLLLCSNCHKELHSELKNGDIAQ